MATEVFDLKGYVFESAAFNAEFAVFNQNVSGYVLQGSQTAASAAVFDQSVSIYIVGGSVPSAQHIAAHNLRLYRLEGPANSFAPAPSVSHTKLYQISGGRAIQARPAVANTNVYQITT